MSPMTKRLPRELKNNIGKYLGIFLLMFVSISLTSGFLLAAGSINVIIADMNEQYNIEDGRFTTNFEASAKQLNAFTGAADGVGGAEVFENYYVKADLKKSADDTDRNRTIQTFIHRTEVDRAAYAEGKEPAAADEVAIDRVFATNNDVHVGDTILLEGKEFKVSGICTLADFQALFSDNSSFTVNTITFGVAEVTPEGFQALRDAGAPFSYNYSFCFKDRSLTMAERLDAEEDMMKALTDADASVSDFIDRDTNQGITYAKEDTEGDSVMWEVLLDILVVVMAFIFVVLTSATIEEESAIIGTLLASGYRRRELVAHYMILPALVGAVACVVGTAVGLLYFTEPMKNLYYGSYSLPPFYVTWDWSIFIKTALVPFVMLVLVTFIGLLRKIGHTPLQFLRHETSKGGVKRAFALPERLSFVARFRLRVFLRNLGNFATLFLGICFAMILLLFSVAILPTMQHYADNLVETAVANHQYSLKAPLELEGTDEERQQWKDIDKLQDLDPVKLREVEDEADALQARADDIEGWGASLKKRAEALQTEATNALTAKGTELQTVAAQLQAAAAAAQANPSAETMAAAQELQTKVQSLTDEFNNLKSYYESQSEPLEHESEVIQGEVDDIEAERDKLYEKIDALAAQIGVTRDEFEDMVERVEGIDLDDDNLHPVNTTDNGAEKIAQAEKYAVYSLEYDRGGDNGNESITVYGIQKNSRYWKNVGVSNNTVVLGGGLLDKFGWEPGTEISLYDKYENKTYTVTYTGSNVYGTKSDMNIYMSLDEFNKFFGNDSQYFSGWASDEELTLDNRYTSSDLTPSDMAAIGDQFVGMMNDMIGMLVGLSVSIFLIFMYLLTKSIIDRSARAISYMKVFGYRDGEVSKLYVRSITWVVVITSIVCLPLIYWALFAIFKAMLLSYSGNIEIYVPWYCFAEGVAAAIGSYAVVALLHMRAIKKVPLALALKVQE